MDLTHLSLNLKSSNHLLNVRHTNKTRLCLSRKTEKRHRVVEHELKLRPFLFNSALIISTEGNIIDFSSLLRLWQTYKAGDYPYNVILTF